MCLVALGQTQEHQCCEQGHEKANEAKCCLVPRLRAEPVRARQPEPFKRTLGLRMGPVTPSVPDSERKHPEVDDADAGLVRAGCKDRYVDRAGGIEGK